MGHFKVIFLSLVFGFFACNDGSKNDQKTESSGDHHSNGRIPVLIGIADACQEPITFEDGSGISQDIIDEFNSIQTQYKFIIDLIPTKRLENLSEQGKVHIAAFSNLAWGWDKSKVKRTDNLLEDKDVFFTLKTSSSDLSKIEDLNVVGVKGFHYNFNKSGKSSFIGADNEKAVIDMVLLKRGEVGVASIFTLQYLAKSNPEKFSKLNISNKYDSEYERYFVVMNNAPIKVKELNFYLKSIKTNGRIRAIFQKYGLINPVIARAAPEN